MEKHLFQSCDQKLIFNCSTRRRRRKRKNIERYIMGKREFVIHLMYRDIYIYMYIHRQCTWVPSCAKMCVVSCHRLQLIDCFSVGPESDLFDCFLFILRFSLPELFTDNFLVLLVYWYNCTCDAHIDRYLHLHTHTHIQSCLSSEVEMIIINDHGSLVVCCWQYLFFPNIYVYT